MSENLWHMAVAEFGSITGEIGTVENFGDKMGGDRPREHCSSILFSQCI